MVTKLSEVDILILGAGWTSTFIIPLLNKEKITHAETTTTGRDGTYSFKFEFDPEDRNSNSDHIRQYRALPAAKTVLITFPLEGKHQSLHLRDSYVQTRPGHDKYNFIQLGHTGIFSIPDQPPWITRHSKYDETNARAIAEDELRAFGGCVLNLSGLWGGSRQPKNWIDRVAATKEQLRGKTSLHLIHGQDVARAIIAVHRNFAQAVGQRFMLTNLLVYDWWPLILSFAGEVDEEAGGDEKAKSRIRWVGELMAEQEVKALPRSMEQLGRCYDSREFWTMFGLMPVRARV